ncbi:MAG: DegT/DnrJ/EryC1/StrS family aminotransferase [Aureispira sp.]|nr:DegT/DnrJ/EryC1/StrS family aminotransferase [Aureispira sp.]
MINVTRPFLPPLAEYQQYIADIWDRNWLTNNGPLVKELEAQLRAYLNTEKLLFLSNGTIALQIAIKALDLQGEIITTPFSYVATTSSIVWENCTPVFVDIDKESFNIDPKLIEASITDKTSAILATHVYGNPCDIDAIATIAEKHNLKVIYDAAHCFGTLYKGKSVFEYGDVSTTSFHATKLFHTTEGGAVVAKDSAILTCMERMRNFGHAGPDKFKGIGINGKNSEMHAAMGLANMKYVDHILAKRELDHKLYDQRLEALQLQKPKIDDKATFNYAYYAVVFRTTEECIKVFKALADNEIGARRYFYPVLSSLDYVDPQTMPVAEDIAQRVLCLPLYEQLTEDDIEKICTVILKTLN